MNEENPTPEENAQKFVDKWEGDWKPFFECLTKGTGLSMAEALRFHETMRLLMLTDKIDAIGNMMYAALHPKKESWESEG